MLVVTSTRINHGRGGLVAGQSSAAGPHNDRSCRERRWGLRVCSGRNVHVPIFFRINPERDTYE